MVANVPYRYGSTVSEPTTAVPTTTVCGLAGCDVAVVQPAGGGRRRLYCSNAHRAEARRRRLANAAEPSSPDVLGASLDRLAGVLAELTRYRDTVAAVDPARQAAETARMRAETTAEVLAAQQAAAKAAEEVARVQAELTAQRVDREAERASHHAELEELRAALAAARSNAASAQDALDQALVAHSDELQLRDRRAVATAAAHQEEATRLLDDLEEARLSVATAEARADAADDRAGRSEAAQKRLADELAASEKARHRLDLDLAKAQANTLASTQRAEDLARRLEGAQSDLETERRRHDASLSQLHDQLAQLLAQNQAPRRTSPRKKRTPPADR